MAPKKVQDVISKDFASCRENDPLSRCLELFEKGKPPALVVLDVKGKYKGVLAQRWITRSGLDPSKAKVENLMRSAPKLAPEDSLSRAAQLMIESEIKQLPVFDKDKLVGFVTDEDIAHAAVIDEWGNMHVNQTMTKKPYVVEEDESVGAVLSLFREHDISHAPVMSKGKLVGMVSVIDFVKHLLKPLERPRRSGFTVEKSKMLGGLVKDIMSSPVVTVTPFTTLRDAEEKMHKSGVHSLVVIEEGKIVGIVTKRDFLEPLAQTEMKERGVNVQFANKEVRIDDIERQHILDDFKSFAERYQKLVEPGTLFVYMKTHGANHRGEQLIHTRLQLRTKTGNFFSSADGYNAEQTFRVGLEHLERQLVKSKEFEETKDFTENYLRRIGWPNSEL
ncbi:MAG: CBS domain-containing protein [Candidatus Atabeyarchaeum deiterrae]